MNLREFFLINNKCWIEFLQTKDLTSLANSILDLGEDFKLDFSVQDKKWQHFESVQNVTLDAAKGTME